MLMISVTILSALVVTVGFNSAAAQIGLVKSYGPAIGQAQPYEATGPYIDGIAYPQFLITQENEWAALKSGALDVYDFAMTAADLTEYNNNICVAAPDAPAGLPPCSAGQAPIQHEIAIQTTSAFDKWEIDFQVGAFPTNVLAFRQAIAWITDKQSFASTTLGGLGVPIYNTIPAGLNNVWLASGFVACQSGTAPTGACYGEGLPIATRISVANTILTNAGFTIATSGANTGWRVNERPGCASDPGGCGAILKPFFYVRADDVLRTALGRIVDGIMGAQGTSGLSIQMTAGCTNSAYPSPQNYCEINRAGLFNNVFLTQNYNMYTGGWTLSRDPTFFSIYDPLGIFPGGTNYNLYNDPVFTQAERGLTDAPTQATAETYAYAAENEYNASLPALDVWSTHAPYAYRIYHQDSDSVLNGLQWTGIDFLTGTGWNQAFTFLNAQLIGAPVHDPAHPVFIKYGIKTDVLQTPNPIEEQFLYDLETSSSSFDTLNALASDDLSFNGDLPWMSSIPVVTANIASGGTFPDGSVCVPDAPATGCQVLTVQMRPDLSFAASLDGSIPAIPVTPDDVVFSTLLARDDPISFIAGSYYDLQNVLDHNSNPTAVPSTNGVLFEFRTQAVWNRHFIGATPIESIQHWCTEAHMGGWPGTTSLSNCFPIGYPNGPTAYTGQTSKPPASTTGCNLDFNDYGIYSCPWPKAPQLSGDLQCSVALPSTTCLWPDNAVIVTSSGTNNSPSQTAFMPGAPVGIDLGSFAFVYDSQNSFTGGNNGPVVFRMREPGFSWPGYTGTSPNDGYFTNVGGTSFTINGNGAGWYKFHEAGDVAWYCTSCAGGTSEVGPLPSPHWVINIVDLSLVAAHFGQSPGTTGFPYGHVPWDLSGPSGAPDGVINIFDLTRVALNFGQSFLGGTDQGGGTEGQIPGWVFQSIPST
jgi:hypothetical protein